MDLYQIRYFLTIAETGNFSRAAERLYLSQPSLSTGIKKLEGELGVILFERGGRKTILTPAGRAFLEKATVIMKEYQAALRELKGFHDQPTLRVGVVITMWVMEIANLMGSFAQHFPNVVLELRDGTAEQLRAGLEEGEIDVALTVLGDREDPQSSALLFHQSLGLALSISHPLAQRTAVRLADLNGQPFIDRIHCEFAQRECEILETAKVRPKVVYRASREEWAISLIRAGLGMAIMPYWRGLTDSVYLPIVDLDFQRAIGLRWRSQNNSQLLPQFCRFSTSHDWGTL